MPFVRYAKVELLDPSLVGRYVDHLHKIFPHNRFNLKEASKNLLNIKSDDQYLYVIVDGIHWSTYEHPYPNGNGDAFHKDELLKLRNDGRLAYQTWNRKGVFLHHQSDAIGTKDHVGFICDTWPDFDSQSVKMLPALDKAKHEDLCKKVKAGHWKDVSMGCIASSATCNHCNNVATVEAELCDCVKDYKGRIHPSTGKLVFEWNHGIVGKELSFVSIGADTKAKVVEILAEPNYKVTLRNLAHKLMHHKNHLLNSSGVEILKLIDGKMTVQRRKRLVKLLDFVSDYGMI